jgi:general secretion pathway protein F
LKEILSRVRTRLAEGSTLARALAEEPSVFSESYINMVAAGEASGALETILDRLADFLEDQETVRSKIITSLAYPALMVVVGTAVMLFLLAFVIPKITVIFEQNKATLPLITILLIKFSTVLRKGWWALALAGAGLVYGYRRLIKRETLRARRDALLLKVPLIGPLIAKLILARFSKILGLLLASGVPVIKALEITGEVVVNKSYRNALLQAREELAEGGSLSASLHDNDLFPPLLVHMVAVGERGGTLESMLIKAGSAFEKEFVAAVTRFMSLLEPLLVLVMGLVVGTVVVAVLLPIFQLNQLVK